MSVEVRAQNTISMTSVKAIKDATDQSAQLLATMEQYAEDAGTTLTGIYQDAEDAKTNASNALASAQSASEYASRALGNLSTVQSVTETLNWITAHGTMTLTSDVALDPSHVYFVIDAQGDYVVNGTHYSVVSEPDVADISTYYELSIDESLNNYVATHLAVDSEGLWIIPDAGGNKVLIATGQGSTYSVAGTYIVGANNVILAKFTSTGAQIGAYVGGQSIIRITQTGLKVIGISGTLAETDVVDLDAGQNNRSFSIGQRLPNTLKGSSSFSAGEMIEASGQHSVGIGYFSTASGDNSIAIGNDCTASDDYAVAIGKSLTASGKYSFAEGNQNTASGFYSHAEGQHTTASGLHSHASGMDTIAQRCAQTVIGRWNIADTTGINTSADGKYIFIVGNGLTSSARSNAFTVDWSGNVVASGNVEANDMLIDLPEYTTADTTDKAIYDALVALGWDSDVLVN